MTKVKKIVIVAVVIVAVIGAIVVKNVIASNAKKANVVVTVSKTAVEVQKAKMVEKNSGDTYKANLEAYQQGIISSKISGKVVSVAFENGQYVNQGDILITLDDQDIRNNIKTSQAQLNSSQVAMGKLKINLDDAKRNYDRQKILFEKKAIAQTDFEAAEKTLNTAQADFD